VLIGGATSLAAHRRLRAIEDRYPLTRLDAGPGGARLSLTWRF